MRVWLLKDLKGIGRAGDLVEVRGGYARNLLFPQKLAIVANEQTIASINLERQRQVEKAQALEKQAKKLLTRFKGRTFEFLLPADKKGNLYAGLKESVILAKIKEEEPTLPNTAQVVDYFPLKEVGSYEVRLKLSPGLETKALILIKNASDATKTKRH